MPETVVKDQDSAFAEFSMSVTKAESDKNGVMRWTSVNSDLKEDLYGERMSEELFKDFIKHIDNKDEVPEPFKSVICEEDWCGGMPYISIAHYKSGAGRANVPGEPEKVFLDGKYLKSKGVLYDTPLGRAVFKSLKKDLVEKREDKARISIGFLDLEHSHGDRFTFTRKALGDKCPLCKEGIGDKIYKKGHLVHLALTRVPANPRTDMEVEKSMTTKREDAESIIEDEEVIKGLDLKSQVEDVLVIKSDKVEEPVVEKTEENTVSSAIEKSVNAFEVKHVEEKQAEVVVELRTFDNTPLEKSLAAFKSKVEAIKSQGLTGENALSQIQADFDELGNVVKAELTPKPSPEQVANQNLEVTLRSLLSEMLPQVLAQAVAPIQSELSELRASSLVRQPVIKKEEAVPQPRSLQLNLTQKSAIEAVTQRAKQYKSFAEIASESVR